jgi:polysaccharide pyruvyl transferase WcaK-like protein
VSRRIALFGLFGSGNLGNDASLAAMSAFLQSHYPDADLTVVCQEPERVMASTGLPARRITSRLSSAPRRSRWLRPVAALAGRLLDIPYALRQVRDFDAIVVPGMGVLEERLGARPWGMPWMLGLWSTVAAVRRVPFALVSVGADDAENRWTRWLFRTTVRRSTYCSFRDDFSRRALIAMGGGADPGPVFPDLAFEITAAVTDGAGCDKGKTTVAVGVLDWYGPADDRVNGREVYERYVGGMAELLHAITQRGHCVRLVVGDAIDAAARDAIRARFAEAHPELAAQVIDVPPAATFAQLCEQLDGCAAVVASRYHNLVAALLLHKPVVSLGYGPKNDALLESFGLAAFGQQLDDLDIARAGCQLADALARRQEIGTAMATQLVGLKVKLGRQFAEVASWLEAS